MTAPTTTEPNFGRCTCHDVREWNDSGSVFGSIADFGGECGACTAANEYYSWLSWWEGLTVAEQIAERWRNATARTRWVADGMNFPDLPRKPNAKARQARGVGFDPAWGEPPF